MLEWNASRLEVNWLPSHQLLNKALLRNIWAVLHGLVRIYTCMLTHWLKKKDKGHSTLILSYWLFILNSHIHFLTVHGCFVLVSLTCRCMVSSPFNRLSFCLPLKITFVEQFPWREHSSFFLQSQVSLSGSRCFFVGLSSCLIIFLLCQPPFRWCSVKVCSAACMHDHAVTKHITLDFWRRNIYRTKKSATVQRTMDAFPRK